MKLFSKIGNCSFIFITIVVLLASCKKDDVDPVLDEVATSDIEGCQYPIAEWAGNSAFVLGSITTLGEGVTAYYAFGFSFSVAFNGTIKELGIKVPEDGKSYTVRIYNEDLINNDILAEAKIFANDKNWNYAAIDPLNINSKQTYMVCVYIQTSPIYRAESFFYHEEKFEYPKTYGDVTIEGYASNVKNEMAKPEPSKFDIFNGFVDFCFEAN